VNHLPTAALEYRAADVLQGGRFDYRYPEDGFATIFLSPTLNRRDLDAIVDLYANSVYEKTEYFARS
jgi:hypothetical protein